MILNNTFVDTTHFSGMPSPTLLRLMPHFLLKRMVLASYPQGNLEPKIADSVDFMVERLESLSRSELISRLCLNIDESYVQPQALTGQNIKIMTLDVVDETAMSKRTRDELYKCYPLCKQAELKDGGNFPYLSRPTEVNMFIQLHLRQFEGSRYSARNDFLNEAPSLKDAPILHDVPILSDTPGLSKDVSAAPASVGAKVIFSFWPTTFYCIILILLQSCIASF